jgi:hypothetical protein
MQYQKPAKFEGGEETAEISAALLLSSLLGSLHLPSILLVFLV